MDSGYERLEEQIAWHDTKSVWHQNRYKTCKLISIVAAALVPLAAAMPQAWGAWWVAGLLGVTVVIVEGIQQMNQHHANWVQYRLTAERLQREKYLYIGRSDIYALPDAEARQVLVGNVEALLTDVNAVWTQGRQKAEARPRGTKADADGE